MNEVAASAAKKILLQPLDVLVPDGGASPTETTVRLVQMGKAQGADKLVVLTTGDTSDWIAGTSRYLSGIGLYRRELFGMRRLQVYGVFQLHVIDCSTGAVIAKDTAPGAREVYAVEWHEEWSDFSQLEQSRLVSAWKELIKDQVGQLLTRAGLANVPEPEVTLGEKMLFRPNRPKSWLPEGNVLPIPNGVSVAQARASVISGLHARGWSVVSETDGEVVGVYRDEEKEAGVTARISNVEIELVANDHEIKLDGSRVQVKPYARWQNNLKESIYKSLLQVEVAQPRTISESP
jgi:hypothetical protein